MTQILSFITLQIDSIMERIHEVTNEKSTTNSTVNERINDDEKRTIHEEVGRRCGNSSVKANFEKLYRYATEE